MKHLSFQRGTSLIEVAITVLLLSTSLLSLATLQKRSLQFNQSAFMRSQANIYAYDIMDRIRINRGAASENISGYTVEYGGTASGNTLANADVVAWRANITRSLPGGDGAIECVLATRVCTISIKWSEEQIFGAQSEANTDATTELVYSSNI